MQQHPKMLYWYLYSILCVFLGLAMFMQGFFLMNYDLTKKTLSNDLLFEDSNDSKASLKKVVLIVIDAMRYDFVNQSEYLSNMPFLQEQFSTNNASLFPCRVNLPTVTMPRIKAMVGGSISSYVDIALNLGSMKMLEDNILFNMKKRGMKIVFYGDETWIKLFPRIFYRYEGTTSFFVRDFYEVDNNVTRNVNIELKNYDWDVMILHYLGLDHIGHIEGPRSPKILTKLTEMDSVIKSVVEYLQNIKIKTADDYIVMICADHGLRDTGGHGGNSLPEIVVPLITIGLTGPVHNDEISQLDIATTIAALLNLPIPVDSIGKMIDPLLKYFPIDKKLKMVQKNVAHLMNKYNQFYGSVNAAFKEKNDYAQKISEENPEIAYTYLVELSKQFSSALVSSLSKFDIPYLFVSFFLVLQSVFLPMLRYSMEKTIIQRSFVIAAISIVGLLLFSGISPNSSMISNFSLLGFICAYIVSILIVYNSICFLLFFNRVVHCISSTIILLISDPILVFISFGSLLVIVSTAATSFIEEEHIIWYFLWATIVSIILCMKYSFKEYLPTMIGLLLLNRILQDFNHVGDQYGTLPDIGNWISKSENVYYLSLFLVFELICLSFCTYHLNMGGEYRFKKMGLFFRVLRIFEIASDIITYLLIYLYRAAVHDVVISISDLLSDNGGTEFEYFQYAAAFSVIFFLLRSLSMRRRDIIKTLIKAFIKVWIFMAAVLMKPFNIVLICSVLLNSDFLSTQFKNDEPNSISKLVFLHHWIAQLHFFLQGNWNNLATVDVAAGYVGQSNYNPLIVGAFIMINTFAMPVLSYSLLLDKIIPSSDQLDTRYDEMETAGKVLLISSDFQTLFYLIIMFVQRHHISLWSIFSPKLLYLSLHSVILYLLLIVLFTITHFRSNKKKPYSFMKTVS